jgi:putative Mg2+ transporter-C (MgtC) family protein
MVDLNLQLDLSGRLLLAAILGAVIGIEREVHEHPAGMRTHMLVAVGCALFTELSIYGFLIGVPGTGAVDPSRLAAQIVSGIGFLGAGAILKYGTSIRGLTTAASLWATAAIGIAAGTGQLILGFVGTAIVLVSLWPLNRVARALRMRNGQSLRVRVIVPRLESLGEISSRLQASRVPIESVHAQRRDDAHLELELELRLPAGVRPDFVITTIGAVPDVQLLESDRAVE